jgi:hypothetical protein
MRLVDDVGAADVRTDAPEELEIANESLPAFKDGAVILDLAWNQDAARAGPSASRLADVHRIFADPSLDDHRSERLGARDELGLKPAFLHQSFEIAGSRRVKIDAGAIDDDRHWRHAIRPKPR